MSELEPMESNHEDSYSNTAIKKSLKYFVLGKGIGALIGVGWLLLLVRALSKSEYGIYVGLVAYLELFVVLSNFGLVPISERYVPEWKTKNQIGKLKGLILFLFKARLLTVCVIALTAAIITHLFSEQLGMTQYATTLIIFQIVVACESFARFIETIFDSLMLQGRAQISLFSRTGTRLLLLIFLLTKQADINLSTWVIYEAVAYAIGLLVTITILGFTYHSLGNASPIEPDRNAKIKFGLPIYGSHVLGVITGIDVIKLLAIRVLGAEATAVFGFCASLAWMMQRYLPSFLLVGLIRPLIVAAAVSRNGHEKLDRITSIVIKLNAMIIGCGLALSLVLGDEIVMSLSGGKFSSGGIHLSIFLLFIFTQTLHAVIGYVGLAKSQGLLMFLAKLVSGFILLITLLFSNLIGIYAYSTALVVSDLVWFFLVFFWLKKMSQAPQLPYLGLLKIFGVVLASYAISESIISFATHQPVTLLSTILASLFISTIFILLCYRFKPFLAEERNAINRMLPMKIFIW